MASVTGKDGYVMKLVSGTYSLVAGIKDWTVDYISDLIDTTAFAEAGVTHKTVSPVLKSSSGNFTGNITDADVGLSVGTSYTVVLFAHSGRAYSGTIIITGNAPAVNVGGEALMTYNFTFTDKCYVLGATVVVDGKFTAATSAAWDVTDADVTYDTTNDQLDFDGDANVVPASNDVITTTETYWTLMKLENETGTTTCQLDLGTATGTSRTADGVYIEYITAVGTTFTIKATTDGTLSLSWIEIRQVLN